MDDYVDSFDICYEEEEYVLPTGGIYAIGDTHFENKAFEQGEALIDRCLKIAEEIKPSIIILLGDIQHTHETAKQSPFEQACRFIHHLSEIAPTFVQIGNHDLINQTQYLSDKHFFNPLKKWKNVTIVDKPTVIHLPEEDLSEDNNFDTAQIVTCPYTPPGRLIEALDTLAEPIDQDGEGIDWTASRCIFGHQEIKGVMYGGKPSTSGDTWLPSFPLFISGHIHKECNIGDNVLYTGSSRQVASDESPNKKVWHILFKDPKDTRYKFHDSNVWINKIDVGIKGILDMTVTYDEVHLFDFELLHAHYITLHIKGTSEQFKIFKKGQLYTKMLRLGIKVRFNPNTDDIISPLSILMGDTEYGSAVSKRKAITFETIFQSLVQTKPDVVQEAYDLLYEENKPAKIVFVGRK